MSLVSFACIVAAINVFQNADMAIEDGLGGPCGWTHYAGGALTVRARNVGDGAFEIVAREPAYSYFRQYPVTLKAGARYRLSAEVKGEMDADAEITFQICNWWWAKAVYLEAPKSTDGEWRRIAWEGPMIESKDETDYSIGFRAKIGKSGRLVRLQVRNLRLEPLDAVAEAGSKPIATNDFGRITARIVPIDPLLFRVSRERAVLTFYWPGQPDCGATNCQLIGSLAGCERRASIGPDGRAVLDFGKLSADRARVEVSVRAPDGATLAANGYEVRTAASAAEGPQGRRLNNFVTELVRTELRDGDLAFFRPEDGFIWISFTDAQGGRERQACGYLDESARATVKFDADEPHTEAVRFVKAGWHRLKVVGAVPGSQVRVHAVKRLGMTPWGVRITESGRCTVEGPEINFTLPFMRRYRLPGANSAWVVSSDPKAPAATFYAARGFELYGGSQLWFGKPALDGAYVRHALMDGMWSKGWDTVVDEMQIGGLRRSHLLVSETMWEMFEKSPGQSVDLFYSDATRTGFTDPPVHATELSAMVNLNDGYGMCFPEFYAPASRSTERLDAVIDRMAEMVRSSAEMVPAAKGRVYMHISPYTGIGHFTSGSWPEVDLKHQYAYLAYVFATDPRFADNAGIGGGPTAYCEEELIRWTGKCYRYYGLEGRTDDLAARYGFTRLPGHVRNPDFAEGLTHWTVDAGSVVPRTIGKFGAWVEMRRYTNDDTGDHFAEFTTDPQRPCRLSQTLTGLEKGRPYALLFVTANASALDDATVPSPPPRAFSAKIEGTTPVDGLTFLYRIGQRYPNFPRACKDRDIHVNTHRYVFRANGPTARLVFEDRDDDGRAAPAGTRQILNYVVIRPYYCESAAELPEIAAALQGKNLNRESNKGKSK